MSFLARRLGLPAVSGPRAKPVTPADNAPLINCCRHLAAQAAGLDDPLRRQLLAVDREFTRVLADPQTRTALESGAEPWPVLAPHLLDLLLIAGAGALSTEPSLTALIADTVLRVRRGSRAAWRLRAQAHEQWGDLNLAIAAHEEYLARTEDDKLGVGALVVTLRSVRDARVSLASALLDAHDLGDTLPMPAAADLHDMLSRPCRAEALDPALEDFLGELTRLPISQLAGVRDVLQAAVHCLRISQLRPPPLSAETVRSLDILRLGDVRGWLAGRSICLVADRDQLAAAQAVAGAVPGLGARIDEYDLVARFGSGSPDPEDGGTRTDLMVIRHDQQTGWDEPTQLRLILAEDPRDWVRAVRHNLVPGAQRGLFDKALRRPAHHDALVDDDHRPARPTNAFQLLRLLDHLDVNPTIDLIGFGPGDPFTDVEQDWLRTRVRRVDEQRVSLR
jgi:hypothetical protein